MIVQSQWKSSSVGGLFSISCDLEGICDENNFRVTNCFGGGDMQKQESFPAKAYTASKQNEDWQQVQGEVQGPRMVLGTTQSAGQGEGWTR